MVLIEELQYISLCSNTSGISIPNVEFLKTVVSLAADLRIIIIVNDQVQVSQEPYIHLDNLFTKLSTTSFLSKFHSLVLISSNFVVSQSILDDFLRKFLATSCNHPQAIKLAYITIEDFMLNYLAIGSRPPSSPFRFHLKPEGSCYLHLKSIEFCLSRFKVHIPLADFVGDWCGQNVSCITVANEVDVLINSFIIDFPKTKKSI